MVVAFVPVAFVVGRHIAEQGVTGQNLGAAAEAGAAASCLVVEDYQAATSFLVKEETELN